MDRKCSQRALVILAVTWGVVALPSAVFAEEESDEWPDLEGTWDMQAETTSKSDVPILGEVRATNRTRRVVQIAQQGDELRVRSEICSIEIEPGTRLASTTIPSAFIDSIDAVVRPARLERNDDGRVRLLVPRHWSVQGAEVDEPSEAELPEDKSDDRVYDQDRTGHPGMTARIDGVLSGEVYLVQRGWDQWFGYVDGDTIVGSVRWDSDQEILGASSSLLENQPDSEPVEDPSENRFRMERRDPAAGNGC